ncbi:cytochrome P450 2L1, partial [Armadillidium vulgare]
LKNNFGSKNQDDFGSMFNFLDFVRFVPLLKAKRKSSSRTKTGATNIVYICNYKTAKEALSKLELADRPHWKLFHFFKEEREKGRAGGITKFEKASQEFYDLMKPFINEHLKTLDPSNPRDLMDDYLIEMTEGKSEEYSHFSITDLTRVTLDLFVAGNDTAANISVDTL